MSKGWVTFCTGGNWLALAEVYVKSLLRFSKHPITIVALNTKVPFRYENMDNVIERGLDRHCDESICYEKLWAAAHNPYSAGLIMDCDAVANQGVDVLLDEAEQAGNYPLCSLHPGSQSNVTDIMKLLGVSTTTTPYLHATFEFSADCKPFLLECYQKCKWLQGQGIRPASLDETVLNVMLWKIGATKYAKTYDPYWDFCENFMRGDPVNRHSHLYTLDRALLFHGCKDVNRANKILTDLSNFHHR